MAEKVKLSELVLDYSIYPRQMVDSVNLRRIRDAHQAGIALPPIVVDRASKRVVDGFHRYKIAQELDHVEIDVEWRDYATENDLRLDAIALNSAHGRSLSPFDIAHCISLGQKHRIKAEKLAQALGITLARLREIEVERKASTNGTSIVLKKTVSHLVGEVLTAHQAEAAAKVGGMRPTYYVNQVINLLEGDLVDTHNEALMERLRYLGHLLEKRMAVVA